MRTPMALCGLLLASALSALAQDTATEYELRVDARLATADVTVRDKRAKMPVQGLTAKDFAVFAWRAYFPPT